MNVWHDISSKRITPESFIACIEISKGGKNKYELDKETGLLILDRVLYTATHYPTNYGFIPKTYAGDNDPLDVLVLCQEVLTPLTLVKCYPIGVVKMVDDNMTDEKIIAIPTRDPSMNGYHDISDIMPHIFDEISHFFEVYKTLERIETTVTETLGRDSAVEIIEQSIKRYQEKFPDKNN
ncbi:MAG: inorganic diphosphatase [Oscillospiraceae bacterium]|nr:inorganic diphosphatase [Oscillospiraceae bacterium]